NTAICRSAARSSRSSRRERVARQCRATSTTLRAARHFVAPRAALIAGRVTAGAPNLTRCDDVSAAPSELVCRQTIRRGLFCQSDPRSRHGTYVACKGAPRKCTPFCLTFIRGKESEVSSDVLRLGCADRAAGPPAVLHFEFAGT